MALRHSPQAPLNGWIRRTLDLLAALLCLAALLAAAYVSTAVFERLPHTEDEIAFLFQARTLFSGQLVANAPALPEFFGMPFVIVRDGMWFGKYPPGYPAVLALGALAGQPWLINPLFGALSVGLIYIAGRRFYGRLTGLVAAGLTVISPFFLIQSGSFLSHTVSLFWTLLFLLLFEPAWKRRSRWAALGAGAVLGMLFLSRPLTAFGIACPFLIWAGIDIVRSRRRFFDYLPIFLAFLPFLGALLAYNNLTTGNMLRMGYELWWPYDRIGFGPDVGVDGGHTLEAGLDSVKLNVEALSSYLLGWPGRLSLAPPLVAVGLACARPIRRKTQGRAGNVRPSASRVRPSTAEGRLASPETWDLLLSGIIIGLMAAYVSYWAAGQMYGPRYYFEALGALMLLSSRGIIHMARASSWLVSRATQACRDPLRLTTAFVFLGVAGLTLNSFTNFVPQEFARFVHWYNVDRSGLDLVEAANLRNALVFVFDEDWPQYAPFFSQNQPTLDGNVVYAIDLGPARNAELMAIYPGRAFFRYAEGRLEPIASQ